MTVCLLRRGGCVALAKKKPKPGKDFNIGKWNGYGGKLEPGETIIEAAIRETAQESGVDLSPLVLKKAAELEFYFAGQEDVRQVHIFIVDDFSGEPQETEEMGQPQWFAINRLADIGEEMWAGDILWMPDILEGRTICGTFYYDVAGDTVEHYKLTDVCF